MENLTSEDIQKLSKSKLQKLINEITQKANLISDSIPTLNNNIETLKVQNQTIEDNYNLLIKNKSTDCESKTLEVQQNHSTIKENLLKQIEEARNKKIDLEKIKDELSFSCTTLNQDIKNTDKEKDTMVKQIRNLTSPLNELVMNLYNKVKSLSITESRSNWSEIWDDYSSQYLPEYIEYRRYKDYQQKLNEFWTSFNDGMNYIKNSPASCRWSPAEGCKHLGDLNRTHDKLKDIVKYLIDNQNVIINDITDSTKRKEVEQFLKNDDSGHLYWNLLGKDKSRKCYSSFYGKWTIHSGAECQRHGDCGQSSGEYWRTERDYYTLANTINAICLQKEQQNKINEDRINNKISIFLNGLVKTTPYATKFDNRYNNIATGFNVINEIKSTYNGYSYNKANKYRYGIILILGIVMVIIIMITTLVLDIRYMRNRN